MVEIVFCRVTRRGRKKKAGLNKLAREVEAVEYEGASLSDMKPRKDTFEMPQVPLIEIPKLREGAIRRGSVKRQSEIVREKKKSRQEEREEEKLRRASYFRKVTGLRKAKVPLMVYSCGGFSRCFRVCRFYDVEGPPVGVEYEAPTPLLESRNL